IAGICASLPASAAGIALVEVPTADDVLEFERPDGVEVRWIVRDPASKPGAEALAMLEALTDLPSGAGVHAYVVGEQALATGGRRHLVNERGLDKDAVSFCGYWRMEGEPRGSRARRTDAPATA